jgi:WD40 repeat protein
MMMRTDLLSLVLAVVTCLSLPGLADDVGINLGPEEIVKAGGSDIVVPGYSVPLLEDWNNDGLQDLLIGEGGGTTPGRIRVYLNVGTEADPCFAGYSYVQAAGHDLTCTASGCLGCFPRVVDWDEDGRKDLLVGLSDGTVKIFMNVTDNNAPAFDAGQNIHVGDEGVFTLDVGSRATPVPVQWNDDGMLDLAVGGLDGAIHVYYNCGCGGAVPPHFFTSPPEGQYAQRTNGTDLLITDGRSSPVIMDFDGDGKKDLLAGNTDGMIFFYKNVGSESLPLFSGYSLVQSNGQPIDLPGTLRSRPFVCYWTGEGRFGPKDGYWDLLVGYGDGKIHLYRGIAKAGDFDADGDLDGDDFTFIAKALDQPVGPNGSAADLNGDGVVDSLDLRLFADLWLAANE